MYCDLQLSVFFARFFFFFLCTIGVSLKFKFCIDNGRAVRANLDSFSSSILLWETRMFPESNFQVTKHILLSERKFQENIEEKHVMRMKIWKISTRWLPQVLILFYIFSSRIVDSYRRFFYSSEFSCTTCTYTTLLLQCTPGDNLFCFEQNLWSLKEN